jgi:glyoxylase-like metal-dependent hydrolase (beta-lactamase superfamily II)
MFGVAACALLARPPAAFAQDDSDIVVAAPQRLAPGVWLIPGALRPDREPDGNTVIFVGPKGLTVLDTGRHLAHRQAIKAFAESRHAPIVAIVNSHWHLDHVSGNPYLKAAYPQAKVYASRAIGAALAGFLVKSAADSRKYLDSERVSPRMKEDIRGDLATIANGAALRPDAPVDASRVITPGGRTLDLRLAPNAATDGDVWVYDRETKVAAVGDLVTLPSPFLDTACPQGWKTALAQIWRTPFRIVVPGHGAPMTRAGFASYRDAFSALIECSGSQRAGAACASDWVTATAALGGDGARDLRLAQSMTEYYVSDVLRAHGGKSAYCRTA